MAIIIMIMDTTIMIMIMMAIIIQSSLAERFIEPFVWHEKPFVNWKLWNSQFQHKIRDFDLVQHRRFSSPASVLLPATQLDHSHPLGGKICSGCLNFTIGFNTAESPHRWPFCFYNLASRTRDNHAEKRSKPHSPSSRIPRWISEWLKAGKIVIWRLGVETKRIALNHLLKISNGQHWTDAGRQAQKQSPGLSTLIFDCNRNWL